MQSYYSFLKNNFGVLTFGWLLTFFSSFGQTFLISLFVPFLLLELALSKSLFGVYYAGATIIASFFLLRFGHVIDERPIRPFTNKVIILLAVACVLLGITGHSLMLFVALIGLRLAGQGLMSHISLSAMSRYFDKNRGKALSIASMGYPVGEMIFPLLLGGIISLWDWRVAAFASAGMTLVLLPFIRMLNIEKMDVKPDTSPAEADVTGKAVFFLQMFTEKRFWIIALPVFFMSFIFTGFFFFQFLLAADKGWRVEIYTLLFAGYGGVKLFFSIYGGILTDRFSASRLFPFFLVPMVVGMAGIALFPGLAGAASFLLLTGITVGFSAIVKSTVIADVYGVNRIGQVRSVYTVVMVFSTALAPLLIGICLDAGFSFDSLAIVSAIVLLLVSLHNFRILGIEKA